MKYESKHVKCLAQILAHSKCSLVGVITVLCEFFLGITRD